LKPSTSAVLAVDTLSVTRCLDPYLLLKASPATPASAFANCGRVGGVTSPKNGKSRRVEMSKQLAEALL
jgi:hypothetical protein